MTATTSKRYADDQELAARYPELVAAAQVAERDLRRSQADRRPYAEIRERSLALEAVLGAAIKAAEAAERVAMGPGAYGDRIAIRKARARKDVRRWTDVVDQLRTIKESYRLEAMGRTGTYVPSGRSIGDYTASGPHIAGMETEPGPSSDKGEGPGIGIDLARLIESERP